MLPFPANPAGGRCKRATFLPWPAGRTDRQAAGGDRPALACDRLLRRRNPAGGTRGIVTAGLPADNQDAPFATGTQTMTDPKTAPDEAFDAVLAGRLADEGATVALAAAIASALQAGTVIHLSGNLGAGKTRLARALLAALGYRERVKSPSFTLVETYNLPSFDLYHFDFYRFSSEDEWRDAGLDEYFANDAVILVEWPEKGAGLPAPTLRIRLDPDPQDDGARLVRIAARGQAGLACLRAVRAAGCCASD